MTRARGHAGRDAAARGRYARLYRHLCARPGPEWWATFGEVERVLGFRLPDSARRYPAWWANSSGGGHSQTLAWQAAGWRTRHVNLAEETLLFEREEGYGAGGAADAHDDAREARDAGFRPRDRDSDAEFMDSAALDRLAKMLDALGVDTDFSGAPARSPALDEPSPPRIDAPGDQGRHRAHGDRYEQLKTPATRTPGDRRRHRDHGRPDTSPMTDALWVLVGTETAGLGAPVHVLALGAQRMRGWTPEGPSFHRLFEPDRDVPPDTVRAHGYTREILERDGEPAEWVYEAFADYAGDVPLVAWDLRRVLDRMLLPEWKRLGIGPIGTRGFCVLRLAQRLLDPVPAGDCKLQTLSRYYRLPRHDAPSPLGDMATVVELLGRVLRPLAGRRGLDSWRSVCEFTTWEWYPAHIGFGRFKGRSFREAETDDALHDWLVSLSQSPNPRNAAVGAWYLARLAEPEAPDELDMTLLPEEASAWDGEGRGAPRTSIAVHAEPALAIYADPTVVEDLRRRIDAARARLAEVEAEYTSARTRMAFVHSRLYALLRGLYALRDRLGLLVEHRRRYLEALLQDGEEEAERVAHAHEEAREELGADYESLDRDAERRVEPNPEQEREIKALWRKLVNAYHPDRHAGEPEKQERYDRLMRAINRARDDGDVETLREIADDPEEFVRRQGWGRLDVGDDDDPVRLRQTLDGLRRQIVTLLDELQTLYESEGFDLCRQVESTPELLDEIAEEQETELNEEIAALEAEADQLAEEIEEITGEPCPVGL